MSAKPRMAAAGRLYLADPGSRARKGEQQLRNLSLALDAGLDPAWTIVEGASWSEGGPAKAPQEFDLLGLHPDAGLVVVEVKAARIAFDARKGWLLGGVAWGRSSRGGTPSPLEQVDRARRTLIAGLRALGIAPDRYLSVGRGLAILEGRPWWEEGKDPAPGLHRHEVLVGRDAEPAAWMNAFADALRNRRRRSGDEAGGLTSAETAVLLESFGFSKPSPARQPRLRDRPRISGSSGGPVDYAEALRLWLPRPSTPVILPSPLAAVVDALSGDERIAKALAAAAGLEDEPRRRLGQVVRHRIEAMSEGDLAEAAAATRSALEDAEIGGAAYDALTRGLALIVDVGHGRGMRIVTGGGKRRSPVTVALATLKLALGPVFASPALAADRIRAAVRESGADSVVDRLAREPERFGKVRSRASVTPSTPALKAAIDNLVAASEAA